MGNISSSNKTIAKNTVFLYARMMVTMVIAFYTSRVLLQNLGVDDFGTYGLVGGIVSIFASLKTMFTVATQRFMNIEIGRGDKAELNKIFNVSVLVNIIIAIVFIVVVEIGGIWLLENKLQIAPERMSAARWVFQFSVIASTITVFNIPFTANIIAREKMDFFAIVSIFDAVAKLVIVLLLPVIGGDRLIIYGLLMLLATGLNLLMEALYCRIKFEESRIRKYPFETIREKFKEMFAFSGWAFFGNVIFALVNEGMNVLLNIFSGVVANAARTIAYQVSSALSKVVSNVYVAVKPQAIQSYARQDMERYYKLMFTGAKVVGYMYILMAIPLYFTLEQVLKWWLGEVPEYAVSFLSAVFIYQLVRVLHESVGTFFVTIGKLKKYQITEFIAQGSALPIAYIGLKFFSMPLFGVFLVMAFSELLNLTAIMILAKKEGEFDIGRYFRTVFLPYTTMTLLCFVGVYLIKLAFMPLEMNITIKTLLLIIVAVLFQMTCLYFAGMEKEEKALFVNMIKLKKI
mgnify:FL=1